MCGIAGIVGIDHSLAPGAITRMQTALRHRGPDDQGLFIDHDGLVALVHTRLSIIDLTPAGHQPMRTADGRYTIVFNGEIYNFRELRKELEQGGRAFASGSDTEVILRFFERDGAGCVSRLRGMYAFAIWDSLDRSLFLARDPFGIKPLYFLETGGGLSFASEVRSLLAAAPVMPHLDPAGLVRFLESGSVAEGTSLVAGVRTLPAGHTMQWRNGRLALTSFWTPTFPAPAIYEHRQAIDTARAALEASVRAHFVSDVPVGVFLSGGLDSTSLVALACAIGAGGGLETYSISVDDQTADEGASASAVAQHFQTRHRTLSVTSADAARLLPEFLAALDVPSVDGFNTWLVSSLAHDAGAKTVLSGLGGDELFGSYPSFARVPMMVRGVSVVGWGQPMLRMGGRALARFGTSARMQRMGEFLQGSSTVDNAYHAYRGIFPHRDAVRLAAFLTGTDEAALRFDRTDAGDAIPSDARDAVSYLELTHYMRNQLLRDSDVMSMAHGLELRVPFVDAVLFDEVARVAPDLRYEVGKRLLIDAVPEVPEFVRHKSKRGFTLPFEKWLQGALGGPVAASSSTRLPVEAREWYQRWSLFIFHQWRERVLGESP